MVKNCYEKDVGKITYTLCISNITINKKGVTIIINELLLKLLFKSVIYTIFSYSSTTSAFGALFFTDAIPFSIPLVEEYISLFPIT